jgi:hypothetical protein
LITFVWILNGKKADKNGNKIVAFARWKIWKEARPKEVWDVLWGSGEIDLTGVQEGILDDVDIIVEQAFYKNGQRMRRNYVKGMPCICKCAFSGNYTRTPLEQIVYLTGTRHVDALYPSGA